MLTLSFDTATDVATSALVEDGDVRGERTSVPRTLLEDVDALLRDAGVEPGAVDALVVGTGPGSFTSTRIGLAVARGLALALDVPVAGVSTLDALAAARPDAFPVVDARRGEVFVAGPLAVAPDALELEPGSVCVGNGAIRYRAALERLGALVPPDADPVHVPHARLHVPLAPGFGPADEVLPIYVRAPDAKARSAA
jgi:tRNA threonylcarbamoyl adenosine modification protein YeaZ